MAAPQITLYTGDVPNRATDSATEFANNADDMVNYLAVIPDEYNELADFVNGAAETAQASANFAGNWSSLSGAYSAGTGVYHDGITWLLLQYTASIQSYEPSTSSSRWLALASLTQQATNTANIATNTSDISTNASDISTNASDISSIKNSNITLSGTKTFSSSPIVPTPTTNTQAANKSYVDNYVEGLAIGVDQTWQDLTSSRSPNVTYTNTTGRPIQLIIASGSLSFGNGYLTIDGLQLLFVFDEFEDGSSGTITIPNGSTYSFDHNFDNWFELR